MDKDELYRLLEWFEKSGLTELAVEESGWKAAMKKEPPGRKREPEPETAPPPPLPEEPASPAPADNEEQGTEMIVSPMVGVFYRSPAADAPPLVESGSRFRRGDPLCILEAMKVMNTLEAEFGGEIRAVLAENGSLVEYGTPLFKVRRDDQVSADR